MTSKVPWPRVLGEGVVIVVSILLGLGIDAWWNNRQAAQLEADILEALREEVMANQSEMQSTRQAIADQLQRLEQFLGSTPTVLSQLPADSLTPFAAALAQPLAFNPRSGAADLLSETAVLSSDGIRARTLVTAWRTRILDAEDEKGRLAQRANEVQDRLAGYAARAGGLGTGTVSTRLGRLPPSILGEIRSDPSVVDAAVLKSAIETVYLGNLAAASQILDSLVVELGIQ